MSLFSSHTEDLSIWGIVIGTSKMGGSSPLLRLAESCLMAVYIPQYSAAETMTPNIVAPRGGSSFFWRPIAKYSHGTLKCNSWNSKQLTTKSYSVVIWLTVNKPIFHSCACLWIIWHLFFLGYLFACALVLFGQLSISLRQSILSGQSAESSPSRPTLWMLKGGLGLLTTTYSSSSSSASLALSTVTSPSTPPSTGASTSSTSPSTQKMSAAVAG